MSASAATWHDFIEAFAVRVPYKQLHPMTQCIIHEGAPHRRRTTDRDFVPWRFLEAGRSSAWLPLYSPASKNLHNSGLMHRSKNGAYSITSSATASSIGGTSRPSDLAVLRLIASSKFTGNWTGRSTGIAPRKMRST